MPVELPESKPLKLAWLMNGPFAEPQPTGGYERFRTPMGGIKIPVNDRFEITEGTPFAFAIYSTSGIPGEVSLFTFDKLRKPDGSFFMVQFVGGPFDGIRPFIQPPRVIPIAFVPLPSERHNGEGRLRVFAQYNSQGDKFHFLQVHHQVTKDIRILIDLSGGPLDGRALDNDAMDSDREGAFWVRGPDKTFVLENAVVARDAKADHGRGQCVPSILNDFQPVITHAHSS